MESHLNARVRGLGRSATVAINDRSNALRAEGLDIFKLGLGQSPFPVPASVVEALAAHAAEKDYLPTQGLGALCDAVAAHTARTIGLSCQGEDVLIGPGSKELMFTLQLVHRSELIIPAPSWVSYAPQAQILGREVNWLPTRREDGWRLRAETLDLACRQAPGVPRLLILNYPGNPTGMSYSAEALAELAEVARAHKVLVLSDEIYGEIHHDGAHRSIAPFYPEGTIVSSGLSKWCGAGGWRLGTFVFPEAMAWLRDAMVAVGSETFTSTSAPIQYAAIRAYQGGPDIDAYLHGERRILKALGRHIAAQLRSADIHCEDPEGAFYLFPDLSPLAERLRGRGLTTSAAMCEQLLQDTQVAILPGQAFGRPPQELTARLAYVAFDGAAALQALPADPSTDLTEAWLRTHCGDVTTAIDRLCDWTR